MGSTDKTDPAEPGPPPQDAIRLRILQTTDVHGNLLPFDYYSNSPDRPWGLTRLATLISRARRAAGPRNCLLLDNGDFLQGTPLSDLGPRPGQGWRGRHPVLRAMNHLRYDAAALGNHEFNFGLGWLRASLAQARFPVICANVLTRRAARPEDDETLLPPALTLTRRLRDGAGREHVLRIGLLGLVPPQILTWDHSHLAGRIAVRDMIETARAWVPLLRERGADLVILLAHSGIDPGPERPMMENAARALARVPGIDAILAGHSHRQFPGPDHAGIAGADIAAATLHGTPCLMAGSAATHLGQLDLTLRRARAGWRVVGHEARLLSAAGAAPCPALTRALAPAHAHTVRLTGRVVGRTVAPLHSYLALLRNDPATQLVNDAQRAALAAALGGTPFEGLPLLSATAPFRTGGRGGPAHYTDIPAGPLRLRDIADLYGFPNTLCGLLVNGAQVRDWLERAVICFRQVVPGSPGQRLLDPAIPGHDFDVIDGLTYRIDITRPPRHDHSGRLVNAGARRILDLCHGDRPVADSDRFVIATNSYRAWGGGPFLPLADTCLIHAGTRPVGDLLAENVARQGTVTAGARATWSFAPMAATEVEIETGPGLRRHPADIAELGATDLGDTANGFARLRLPLPALANPAPGSYVDRREVGAGRHLANPVRSGRKQP